MRLVAQAAVSTFMMMGQVGELLASPRFHPSEARQISVEDSDWEYWSTLWHYRFSDFWDDVWRQHDIGYRVRAGSMNNRQFDFMEQLKFASDPYGEVDLSFQMLRRDNLVDQDELNEIKLAVHGWQQWYGAIFGHVQSEKKYGDAGLAVEHRRHRDQRFQFYYLSLNTTYRGKNKTADRMSRSPFEAGFQGRWNFGDFWLIEGQFSYTHPLQWWRPTQDYEYFYTRRWAYLMVHRQLPAEKHLSIRLDYDHKQEGKDWLGQQQRLPLGGYYKHLNRQFGSLDIRWADFAARPAYKVLGVQVVGRDARYDWPRDLDEDWFEDLPQRPSNDLWRRDYLLYGQRQWPLDELQRHRLQLGFAGGHVAQRTGRWNGQSVEVRADVGWEFQANERSYFQLRVTFDVDEIVKYYPYNERRPSWDGGQGQFMMVF